MAKSIISMPTRQKRNKARSWARYELRRLLLAQVKTPTARIAELEAAIDALTLSGADCYALVLELEEREEKYRIRIAELETALSKEAQR